MIEVLIQMRRPAALLACLLLLPGLLLFPGLARADSDPLRVGNDAPTTIASCIIDMGIDRGFFLGRGLDVRPTTYSGSAKGQPALIAGSIDVLLGAGSEMAFIAKGAPERAVAVVMGAPASMALIVPFASPLTALKDLRGHRLGITNTGSLTDWLARQVAVREGFGANGMTIVAGGTTSTEMALLRTGAIDAAVVDLVQAHALAADQQARLVQAFGSYVPDFAATVLYARQSLIDETPRLLRAFLAAWFDARTALLSSEAVAQACVVRKTAAPADIAAQSFREVAPYFSPDGRFQPAAMAVLAQSFVETGVLAEKPDMTQLYTEAFLPAR